MRIRILHSYQVRVIAIIVLLFAFGWPLSAQAAAPGDPVLNPVADPGAIIISGQARFTILTSQLIRMEWSPDAKFEDHASLVFINQLMPVPSFKKSSKEPRNKDYSQILRLLRLR